MPGLPFCKWHHTVFCWLLWALAWSLIGADIFDYGIPQSGLGLEPLTSTSLSQQPAGVKQGTHHSPIHA